MRSVRPLVIISICVLLLSVCAFAGQNQMGIADRYKVNFPENVMVANTILPAGDYNIQHVMDGSDHIMVFTQTGVKKPVEVRAKCTLVPLPVKADDTQKIYELNASNQRVLHELIFKGDTAKHVF
jgi:hypothetical protein